MHHDKTALAEAEVEYENHTSPTVWVKYALLDDPANIDAASGRQETLHHHLDHDSMDSCPRLWPWRFILMKSTSLWNLG